MRILRTSLVATAVALLAGTATVTAAYAQTGSSAAQPAAVPTAGVAHLSTTSVNLPGNGTWTNTPLQVTLPRRGTYELDANVRGRLAGTTPVNSYITARLWNVTAGATVPQSERLVYQIINIAGGNATAPISELVTVTGPTTIQLQGRDINASGSASISQIYSDSSGWTSLRFVRVRP